MNGTSFQLIETMERVRASLHISEDSWLDALELNRVNYLGLRSGQKTPSANTIEKVAKLAGVHESDLLAGEIDFKALKMRSERQSPKELPEKYRKAAYGRWRSSATSLDFLEARYGWRSRHNCVESFDLQESMIVDPFSKVSMRFITDLCDYLYSIQFSEKDLFEMGAYSTFGNKNTVLGERLKELSSPKEIYQTFFGEMIPFFENNCLYRFLAMNDSQCILEVTSRKEVTQAMGVKHLGSSRVCKFKEGVFSSAPAYLDLPWAQVRETKCVHRGDEACVFEIDYALADAVSAQKN